MAIRVRSSMDADRFIRQRGGRLYVWLGQFGAFGTLEVSTKPPRDEPQLELVHAGGFDLMLDRGLQRPKVVEVSLRRWPRKRLRVRGLRFEPLRGGSSPEIYPEDVVIWDSITGGGGGGGGNGGGGNGGGA